MKFFSFLGTVLVCLYLDPFTDPVPNLDSVINHVQDNLSCKIWNLSNMFSNFFFLFQTSEKTDQEHFNLSHGLAGRKEAEARTKSH